MPAKLRVVIVSDRKRGHENQSRVVARMLGDAEPLLMLLRPGAAEWPLRLRLILGGGRRALSPAAALAAVQRLLKPECREQLREFAQAVAQADRSCDDPVAQASLLADADSQPVARASPLADADNQLVVQASLLANSSSQAQRLAPPAEGPPVTLFIVSTGTPPATLNLALARLLGGRAIVCMTPSLLPRRFFDLCIVPEHDLPPAAKARDFIPQAAERTQNPRSANVIPATLALSYHDQTAALHLARRLCAEQALDPQGRYFGLAIGGPSKSCPWPDQRILPLLERLRTAAQQADARLLVTTSRRTPKWCLDWLYANYVHHRQVAYFLDNATDPLNPLPAFYELSAGIAVTEDSHSMLGEAIQAGHRPALLPAGELPPRGKLARAIAALSARDWLLAVPPDGAIDLAALTPPRGAINGEYERLRAQVRERLQL